MADIDRNALAALIEAVEGGRLSEVPHDLAKMPRELWEPIVNANSGSLNAAKALHEALLPGYFIDFKWWTSMNSGAIVTVGNKHEGKSLAPARSWLLAILRALAAEGGE